MNSNKESKIWDFMKSCYFNKPKRIGRKKHALTLPKLHDVTQNRLGTSCLRVLMVGSRMGEIMFLGFIMVRKRFKDLWDVYGLIS